MNILRLIRFDKPVGTLLLWYPTAWALWLASSGNPPWNIVLYFFIGTFLMRSAGCVLNDIADRHIDQHVKRTSLRPLTSGKVSLPTAFFVLFTLFFLAFIVLIQLPKECFYEALLALLLTAFYPFCKRFFDAPQLILGVAFSMGIPMAYTALHQPLNTTTGLLLTLNFIWIIAYDTLYAMADKPDDLRIGVKSTAILLGQYWHIFIMGCLIVMSATWLFIAYLNDLSEFFYFGFSVATTWLIAQNIRLHRTTLPNYTKAFIRQSHYGLLMWVTLILEASI